MTTKRHLISILNGKTIYSGRVLNASDNLANLEQGIYKIYSEIPKGYPADVDKTYAYGTLFISATDAYKTYYLCVTDASAIDTMYRIGFCYNDHKIMRWAKGETEYIMPWMPSTAGNGLHYDPDSPDRARLVLYKISDANWSGIGCDPAGNMHIRVGLAADRIKDFHFNTDGHIYCNGQLLV